MDLLDEAEPEGARAEPATERAADDGIDVAAHKRAKRGRKPLDPALPRELVRHELPAAERVCLHDSAGCPYVCAWRTSAAALPHERSA